MKQIISYNLNNLLQFLTNLKQKSDTNHKIQLFDYSTERFVDIELIEFDEKSGTIFIK